MRGEAGGGDSSSVDVHLKQGDQPTSFQRRPCRLAMDVSPFGTSFKLPTICIVNNYVFKIYFVCNEQFIFDVINATDLYFSRHFG